MSMISELKPSSGKKNIRPEVCLVVSEVVNDYYRLKEVPLKRVRLLSAFARHLSESTLNRNNCK